MTQPFIDPHDRLIIEANGLRAEALDANRSGRLTQDQAQRIRSRRRGWGAALIVIGAICIVLGARQLMTTQGSLLDGERLGPLTVLIGGGLLLALRFSDFGRSYAVELAAGRVHSIEGFIQVHHSTSSGEGGSVDSYHYRIAGHDFETTQEGAKLIDAKATYRIYYVPGSDIMVNIECGGPPFAERLR